MEKELNKKVESILESVKPSLGGIDIRLKDIRQGVVTLEYHRVLSNPTCHVDGTKMNKEMVIETLHDKLGVIVPGFKEIILLGRLSKKSAGEAGGDRADGV